MYLSFHHGCRPFPHHYLRHPSSKHRRQLMATTRMPNPHCPLQLRQPRRLQHNRL